MLINNLHAHVANHRATINEAINRVLDRSWFILGPEVGVFEQSFASYLGVSYCVTVANGTDALEIAFRALNIGTGDKIATVANAGMYTTTAIMAIGAIPIYMDVDLNTHVVTVDEVKKATKQGVKIVVVTHLYGQSVIEIEEIAAWCKASGVALVEDCAQAHGAMVNGKRVGGFGDAGCFSFYPTKNLGALGDGGAVVCRETVLAKKIGQLRQYGWSGKYNVELAGARNTRLDEMQAAILSEFLPYLDGWNVRRREIAARYSTEITHPSVVLPPTGKDDYVAHLYVICSPQRDALREHMRKRDIVTDIHYPIPDYRQPVFGRLYSSIRLSITERLAQEILTLPCYPEMTDADINIVVEAVNSFQIGT